MLGLATAALIAAGQEPTSDWRPEKLSAPGLPNASSLLK